jgi:hypothetical protein
MTTTIIGHSDVNGWFRTAPIAITLPQQIYKHRSTTVGRMVLGIFLTQPDRPWGLPSLLYKVHRVSLGGEAAGAWR